MACGVPVACANVSSMPEVAGNAAILFDPQDETAISDPGHRILPDKRMRDENIGLGLTRSNEYSWKRTAARRVESIRCAVEMGVG